jgi:hypothetical protein
MKRMLAGLLAISAAAAAAAGADRTAEAKTLFFDRHYAEARAAWIAVRDAGGGEAAPYWIARCSELLGEHERALDEYGRYLASRPRDAFLVDEARTSQVGLAARLYREGKKKHLRVMVDSLEDPSRTVRYFAALQLASLGSPAGRPALPVLRRIVAEERDPDLVERAKLALLRLEPHVLPPVSDTRPVPGGLRSIHVRIREEGKPKVTVDFPLALAELVFKNLPDEARHELKKRGYEAESFLHKLKELGPTRIVEINGDGGDKVEIWID